MPVRLLHRALTGFSALWFAMLIVAGPVLHECAMHDGAAAVSQADAHAEHGGSTDSSPDDDGCEHCTCVGECAGSALVAGLADVLLPQGFGPASSAQTAAHALAPATGSPDVRLPFALGPPPLA